MKAKAYLQVTMIIPNDKRQKAAAVYTTYRQPFLNSITGAISKELLIRNEDVQVLHGFDNAEHAKDYLNSELFSQHVFPELKATWSQNPEVKIYTVPE